MPRTYQTKIKKIEKQSSLYLDNFAMFSGKLERKLFFLTYAKGIDPTNQTKQLFSKQHGLTSRQYNSIQRMLKGTISSVREKQIYDLGQLEEKIKSIKSFLKTKEERKLKQHELLMKTKQTDKCFEKRVKNYRKTKFVIHHKKRRLIHLERKLTSLQNDIENKKIRICFGSKKLFMKQFHLSENGYKNHHQWKNEWLKARSSTFFVLGSKDETCGNQTCTYDENDNLRLRVMNGLTQTFGTYVTFPNITFSHGQNQLNWARVTYNGFTKTGKPQKYVNSSISYRFVKKNNDWYIYATTDIPEVKLITNSMLGRIGVDFNVGFLAICETDRFGNPVECFDIDLKTHDRNANQVKATIGDAIKELIEYAKLTGKPIVIEKLDFAKKKASLKETNKKTARMLSSFAYSLFHNMLKNRCTEEGIELKIVNPVYTSQMGHVKYMGRYGLSSHASAACMIARKSFYFKKTEKLKTTIVLSKPKNFKEKSKRFGKWVSLTKHWSKTYDFKTKIELLKVDS